MAIIVHTGRFLRKMTFDMKVPPVAIKVHTGRFIRKMTFDMEDVHVTVTGQALSPIYLHKVDFA